jgi:multidrug efflux pump subunit AcrA (membrane-fusion protein)
MSPFVTLTIAAVSAIVAVGSLLLSLHASHRSDRDSAREEALALAETRKQMIDELRAQLEQTRVEARHNLIVLRCRLEDSPPDVDGVLRRIRNLLEHESATPC